MNTSSLPIIDQEQLKNNPPELLHELFSLLAQELPITKVSVNESISANNFIHARELLHKLQGSCVYCGLTRLKSIAYDLDSAIKQKSYKSEMLDSLNKEIDAVMEEIKKRKLV